MKVIGSRHRYESILRLRQLLEPDCGAACAEHEYRDSNEEKPFHDDFR